MSFEEEAKKLADNIECLFWQDFLAQLWSNAYWLKLPTTIDDYVGMFLIFFGMYAAKYTLFG